MNTIFRIDDIGASTKYFNQHGKKWVTLFGKVRIPFPLANFWFFKRIEPFRGWAKYDELTSREWKIFLDIFEKNKIVPVIAITATWVDKNSRLIPFPEKFPEEARILKEAFLNGKIIIANHGLTHCVVGKHLPRFFSSNREYWREFYSHIEENVHKDHIIKSQKILEDFFEKPIEIFVPPGNIWSIKTYKAFMGTNIKKVMANKYMSDSDVKMENIEFQDDEHDVCVFHDRELKLFGAKWLLIKINHVFNENKCKE